MPVCAASTFKVLVDKLIPVPADNAVLETSIAALPFTSALTITPDPMEVTPAFVIAISHDTATGL